MYIIILLYFRSHFVYSIFQVIFLGLTRPKRFNYQPGDYIFLKIPSIAKYEWHPFTMSSSPEQDFIGLHIRAVGTWTDKLYKFVYELNKALKKGIELAEKKLNLEINPDNSIVLTNVDSIDTEQEKGKEHFTTTRRADESKDFCKRIEVCNNSSFTYL